MMTHADRHSPRGLATVAAAQVLGALAAPAAAQEAMENPADVLMTHLRRYCFGCHGKLKQRRDLNRA